jgi:glycerol 3-phosphatase-2
VLSGSHGPTDLLAAGPTERPTHLGLDLRALLQPPLVVTVDHGVWRCGSAAASITDGIVRVAGAQPDTVTAIWAAAHAAWWLADQGQPVDPVIRPARQR